MFNGCFHPQLPGCVNTGVDGRNRGRLLPSTKGLKTGVAEEATIFPLEKGDFLEAQGQLRVFGGVGIGLLNA